MAGTNSGAAAGMGICDEYERNMEDEAEAEMTVISMRTRPPLRRQLTAHGVKPPFTQHAHTRRLEYIVLSEVRAAVMLYRAARGGVYSSPLYGDN